MDYCFDDWKKVLSDFKDSVSKDLAEIRKHKDEVRQIKSEIFDAMNNGYFLRDDHRIVLSAPEIIIGDVDRDGIMNPDEGSHVIIRAGQVKLDGVGSSGQVQTRAASILQTAINPGIDGQEEVVESLSQVITQAKSVSIDARNESGAFSSDPHGAADGCVLIHADAILNAEASASVETRKTILEGRIAELEAQKKVAEKDVKGGLDSFQAISKSIADTIDAEKSITQDVMLVRVGSDILAQIENQMQSYAIALHQNYESCARSISHLAEVNRQITALKKQKSALKSAGDFKKNLTGASVSIVGERVDIVSRDGDGNIRDNEGAGLGILANDIQVRAVDAEGALQKEGKLFVNAQTIELSTVNSKDLKYDDKGKLNAAKYTAEGDVLVRSKTVTLESVDSELKDGKMEEKALTKDSSLSIRTESTSVSATETEGKATGSIALNAKDISVRSMDVEKEKRTDDKLAAGSTMMLLSEKMHLGARDKDNKSKKLQAVSEEMGLFADKTLEAQQGDAKAVLQLAGGNAAVAGSKTQIFGETTVNGKTEIKGDVKAPKATIDNLEAKTSFKSSNISDGIAVPAPAAAGSLSAKLKTEDAPQKK